MNPNPSAASGPLYEVYEDDDVILPSLTLPNPCGVRVELHEDCVRLFVGQRDWSWNRKTGILSGAGTEIDPAMGDANEQQG
jgi:hypothetical protein